MNPPSLREICAKATPGKRETSATLVYSSEGTICACGEPRKSTLVQYHRTEISSPDLKEQFANAQLIARFSPATALAVYEALEDALGFAKIVAPGEEDDLDMISKIEQLTGRLQDAKALLDGRTEP